MSSGLQPLVPYGPIPDLVLLPAHTFGGFPEQAFSIKPFGVLVALGVYAGAYFAARQGKRRGLSEPALSSFMVWVVAIGFVCAHVLDAVFYYPRLVLEHPLMLLRLWDGLSSFGGFIGATIGGFAWRAVHRTRLLPYADVLFSVFPVGWIFGRLGCTVAHDHPGIASQLFLAVRYPGGGRLDLGLLELLITLPLAAVVVHWWRRPRPFGSYAALVCLYYAPLRFLLDFLRAREPVTQGNAVTSVDARYGSLTPAQWACMALFACGVGLLLHLRRHRQDPGLLEPPPVPAAFA